jgi:hypothetical protein
MMMYCWSDLNVPVTELSVAGRAADLQTEAQGIHPFIPGMDNLQDRI